MATEKRLIDTNVLMEDSIWKCGGDPFDPYYMGYQDALDNIEVTIENQPTVDAVEVVRCKDCTHWDGCICRNPLGLMLSEQNCFCSYGERKGNEN